MRFDAIMFDLDGTLVDTLQDIACVGNHTLEQLGLPVKPVDEYRYLAGQGARWLLQTALGPQHQHLLERGLSIFKPYQVAHGTDHAKPYPGIPELLDEIAARGLKTAVLSNKPDEGTQAVIRALFSRWKFDVVQGQKEGIPVKPDPTSALDIARRVGIPPARWLYVGDTRVDMLTATAAGFYPLGVLWGFRDEAELRESGAKRIVSTAAEILTLLDSPVPA